MLVCLVSQLSANTCQEDEEKPETVKEDEFNQKNNAKKPFAVALQAVIHNEVEHGVGVYGNETNREGDDVVEIVKGNKVARRMISNNKHCKINCKHSNFHNEKQDRCKDH